MAFAKTGNPNSEYLSGWEPYTTDNEVTMVFAEESRAVKDLDKELVYLVNEIAPPMMPGATAKKKK